jgi:hypothetical protein
MNIKKKPNSFNNINFKYPSQQDSNNSFNQIVNSGL